MRTASVTRIPTVTVEQMREVDRLAVDVAGVSLMQMMENAGRGLAVLVRRRLGGDLRGRRVVVLAGTGGNGGGGLVAARRMANWGATVDVVLTTVPENLRGVLAHQLRALALTDVTVRATPDPALLSGDPRTAQQALGGAHAIVDAVIGYGVSGAPRGAARELIDLANSSAAPVFSLDVPSGLDPDTGTPLAPTVRAAATLTLALPKTGLVTAAARDHVGDLHVLDIGIPPEVLRRVGVDIGDLFARDDLVEILPEHCY